MSKRKHRKSHPNTCLLIHTMNMLRMGLEQRLADEDAKVEDLYADVICYMYRAGQELNVDMNRVLDRAEALKLCE